MENYDTMVEAINGLQEKGFTHDFNFEGEFLKCKALDGKYQINDFKIMEHHHFEGISDPADLSDVYAIETNSGVKGVLTDGYGISSTLSYDMIKKIASHKQ